MELAKFYFTFGLDPDRIPNVLNCASVYSTREFEKTKMFGAEGNFSRRCWETITLNIAVNKCEEEMIFLKAKKLTRRQKEALSAQKWHPRPYLCVRDAPNSMVLLNKDTGKTIVFEK